METEVVAPLNFGDPGGDGGGGGEVNFGDSGGDGGGGGGTCKGPWSSRIRDSAFSRATFIKALASGGVIGAGVPATVPEPIAIDPGPKAPGGVIGEGIAFTTNGEAGMAFVGGSGVALSGGPEVTPAWSAVLFFVGGASPGIAPSGLKITDGRGFDFTAGLVFAGPKDDPAVELDDLAVELGGGGMGSCIRGSSATIPRCSRRPSSSPIWRCSHFLQFFS